MLAAALRATAPRARAASSHLCSGLRRHRTAAAPLSSARHDESGNTSDWWYWGAAATTAGAAIVGIQSLDRDNDWSTNPVTHCAAAATSAAPTVTAPYFLSKRNATATSSSSESRGGPVPIGGAEDARFPGVKLLHRMQSVTSRGLNEKYHVDWDTVLGEGSYGSVHPGRLAATGEKIALKRISRKYTDLTTFRNEIDALLRIYENGGHPNISGLRDSYEDAQNYYLILDLVTGGEMFEHLIHFGAYSEADAARLMHEIASALAFLHGVGVVHADLKPENLLLSTKNRLDGTIKLIDLYVAASPVFCIASPRPASRSLLFFLQRLLLGTGY
jgi:Protein kinase domain